MRGSTAGRSQACTADQRSPFGTVAPAIAPHSQPVDVIVENLPCQPISKKPRRLE